MRLIDANAFKRDLIDNYGFFPAMVMRALEKQPTISPDSLRAKGWWLRHDYTCMRHCSECTGCAEEETDFCPHCGADMRGEE